MTDTITQEVEPEADEEETVEGLYVMYPNPNGNRELNDDEIRTMFLNHAQSIQKVAQAVVQQQESITMLLSALVMYMTQYPLDLAESQPAQTEPHRHIGAYL